MLRFWLLGGFWPTLPWEFFVTMGGAFFGAAVLFPFLFPLWTSYPIVGYIELGFFLAAGVWLLTTGLLRRKHTPRRGSPVVVPLGRRWFPP
jgi:hypothetical protein